MRAAGVIIAMVAPGILMMCADSLAQNPPPADIHFRCTGPDDPRCMQSEAVPSRSYVVRSVLCYTRGKSCKLPDNAPEGKPCQCPDGEKGKSGIHEETVPETNVPGVG